MVETHLFIKSLEKIFLEMKQTMYYWFKISLRSMALLVGRAKS